MWQRIQTIFLALVVLSSIVSIFLPIWALRTPEARQELYALHYSVTSNPSRAESEQVKTTEYFPYSLTGALLAAAATLAITSIRRYDNRMLQMKLGALNSVFLAGALGAAVYFANGLLQKFPTGVYGLGLWLPAIGVIANWAAMRFIRRDEKLVRDSERLR